MISDPRLFGGFLNNLQRMAVVVAHFCYFFRGHYV